MSAKLTDRQIEVIELAAKGFTNNDIGRLLGLSPGTVKLHMSAVIQRLDASNRTEAASLWLSQAEAEANSGGTASSPGNGIEHRIVGDSIPPKEAEAICDQVALFLRDHEYTPDAAASLRLTFERATSPVSIEVSFTTPPNTAHVRNYSGSGEDLNRMIVEIGSDILAAIAPLVRPQAASPAIGGEPQEPLWQGQYLIQHLAPDKLAQGVSQFAAALEKDPADARALIGLAQGLNHMAIFAGGGAADLFRRSIAASQAAIALAPSSSAAHEAFGYAQIFSEWDWEQAAESLNRARVLDPGNEEAMVSLSLLHLARGDLDQSLALAAEGWRLNRQAISNYVSLGHIYRERGEIDAAVRHFRASLEVSPDNLHAGLWLALCLAEAGDLDTARATLRPALATYSEAGLVVAIAGYIAGLAGDKAEAQRQLALLESMREESGHSRFFEGLCLIGLGRAEPALAAFDDSLEDRVPLLIGWRHDPVFAGLKSYPQYEEIAATIGV